MKVEIYTKFLCPYCSRALALFQRKGVPVEDYDVTMGGAKFQEMVARANGRTSKPQIFIDDKHIGGSDDLAALERDGKLDALLGL